MTDNNSIPGMMFPTQKGMPAGNPRESAIANMHSGQQSAALASKLLSGGKRLQKRLRGGNINVPQFQMLYDPQGGRGTNPNDQIQGNSLVSTQSLANSAGDSGAIKMGGYKRRSRRGGNPDWVWGCMSGGKSRRTRTSRRSKRKKSKSRKSKRKY